MRFSCARKKNHNIFLLSICILWVLVVQMKGERENKPKIAHIAIGAHSYLTHNCTIHRIPPGAHILFVFLVLFFIYLFFIRCFIHLFTLFFHFDFLLCTWCRQSASRPYNVHVLLWLAFSTVAENVANWKIALRITFTFTKTHISFFIFPVHISSSATTTCIALGQK